MHLRERAKQPEHHLLGVALVDGLDVQRELVEAAALHQVEEHRYLAVLFAMHAAHGNDKVARSPPRQHPDVECVFVHCNLQFFGRRSRDALDRKRSPAGAA
eukprot:scaffold224672_cov40-Prasinocladus_malaysianus.AAC.2